MPCLKLAMILWQSRWVILAIPSKVPSLNVPTPLSQMLDPILNKHQLEAAPLDWSCKKQVIHFTVCVICITDFLSINFKKCYAHNSCIIKHLLRLSTWRCSVDLFLFQKIVSKFICQRLKVSKLRHFQTKKVSQLSKDKIFWPETISNFWFSIVFQFKFETDFRI